MTDPAVIIRDMDVSSGPGSIALFNLDAIILLLILHTKPSMSLRGYQRGVHSADRKIVSALTILRFFNSGKFARILTTLSMSSYSEWLEF